MTLVDRGAGHDQQFDDDDADRVEYVTPVVEREIPAATASTPNQTRRRSKHNGATPRSMHAAPRCCPQIVTGVRAAAACGRRATWPGHQRQRALEERLQRWAGLQTHPTASSNCCLEALTHCRHPRCPAKLRQARQRRPAAPGRTEPGQWGTAATDTHQSAAGCWPTPSNRAAPARISSPWLACSQQSLQHTDNQAV